ncbi:probable multidrug resistance-associated protein lethal(2)03659 [Sipha flava]|uniref:Probable multidrug resistance-associated protein lethal(2)03659 n=1 Tax=Sipha flava TaxID=143950 RepID=A0A8B8F8V8_9HEMI|nr:probable multidrug resistance-associated protein lethal(2)03659 [Sipha flava]
MHYRYKMDAGVKEERPPNPRAGANIFKILTFSWTLGIFKTGRKKALEVNDLYTALDDYKSSLLGDELEKKWKFEVTEAKNKNRDPSLIRVLIKMFGAKIFYYGLIQIFIEVILRMSQPILIGGLISYFNSNESNTNNKGHAYFYASGLLLTILINIFLFHLSLNELIYCGMQMRVACCSVIFKKALRLSNTSIGETNIGKIVNLLSNDVNRFDIVIAYMHFLWIGPLGTIVATYFLWQQIGVSTLFGIAVLIMFIPLQGWLGKKISEFRLKIAPRTDDRVKLMNEIISGIQVIKMYTWEKPFAYLVQQSRKLEIDQIKSATHIKATIQSFIIFHTRIAIFSSILSYVLLGNYITSQKVFILVAYYNILLTTMTVFFPQAIVLVAEVIVSINRIQSFLLNNEKQPETLSIKTGNTDNINSSETLELDFIDNTDDKNQIDQLDNFSIDITNASAKWIHSQPDNTLNNINLTVKPGQLVAIIGAVGAGKSSLIQAILRELELSEGKISVCGEVSYASQEPWLFNGSVQQNIIFDSPMNAERYEQVIHVCALKTDLKLFPYGDKTIVGERGVSLSGGQRARINLARAIYKQADIYLLDDPLSAVDTHVGNHLFQKCIKDYLKEKTCVLITHQKQYLSNVDRIVLMDNASIVSDGNYHELQSADINQLLVSSEVASIESDNGFCIVKDKNKNSSDNPTILFRQDSIQSVSSSVNESKIKETQIEPIEEAEICSTGNVSKSVYFSYIFAGENICQLMITVFATLFTYIICSGGDYWISFWVNQEERPFNKIKSISTNSSIINGESTVILPSWSISRETCVTVYVTLNFAMILICFIRNISIVSVFMGISKNLHNTMFNAITRAKMQFFHSNSSGRILNRFTKDMGAIDEILPLPILFCIHTSMTIIGTIFIIGIVNFYLLIPTFIAGFICYKTIVFYLPPCRSIKRLEGVTRSFVFAHLNASFQGLTTIRAFKAEDILSKEFDSHQDLHSSALHLFIFSNAAFGFILDIICFTYISVLVLGILTLYNETYGGNFGLIITQTMNITGLLQWGVKQFGDLENQMTSVERILEYTNAPKEAALESSPEKKPPKEWPDKGLVVFQNVYLRYNEDSPYVLKNISMKIQPMEKVGVVGRTGAGKSSLIEALFRLAINEGNIIIDGIEIHELGLHDLRSKLSIIPQNPVLFSGTIRTNLDPFNKYPDHVLWNALDEVELKKTIESLNDGLDSKMFEGGSNFSVGQRQLVCLARAIIQNNKFLMLDEATANIDSHTDELIQNTIRNKFRACTILTIAHRLNTVMDSDKILVMDAGAMVEFDHPHNLLKNKDGFLFKMVEQTGQATANMLHRIANESYKKVYNTAAFSTEITSNSVNEIKKNS